MKKFRPYVFFDADDPPGGGGDPAPEPKPAAKPKTDDKDFAKMYADLSQTIDTDYVTRKSYAKLQANLQEANDARATLSAEIANLKEQLTALPTAQSEIETLKTNTTTLEKDKGTLQAELDKLNLIVNDYPQLVGFLKDKLLPDAPIAELPAKLEAFSKAVAANQLAAQHLELDGSSDPPKPIDDGNNKPDLEAMRKKVQDLALAGKKAEYDAAYAEYMAAKGVKVAQTGPMRVN